MAITVFTDNEWNAFARALGNPNWTEDERFATALTRSRHTDELDSKVESWTLQHSPEEVMHLLQAVGVGAGVVQTGADIAERDPQLKERGFFRRVLDADGVSRTIEGPPYKLSRTPGGATRGAPDFGSSQTYVLRDVLGMSDDELASCAIEGVFE